MAYYPQCDGRTWNRTLRAMIAKHAKEHVLAAPVVCIQEQTTCNHWLVSILSHLWPRSKDTHRNHSLYMVDSEDYRVELTQGLNTAWKLARQNIAKAQQKQKKQYDKQAKPPCYHPGDWVMVYMSHEHMGSRESWHYHTMAHIMWLRCWKMVFLYNLWTSQQHNQSWLMWTEWLYVLWNYLTYLGWALRRNGGEHCH